LRPRRADRAVASAHRSPRASSGGERRRDAAPALRRRDGLRRRAFRGDGRRGEQARYEQAVLRALEETEDALVGYGKARLEDEQLALAASESAEAVRLARLRFDAGATDLFQVLDAERTLLQSQDAAAQARTRSYASLVQLYKALAGGWPGRIPALAANP
jgi:outer membrane protein TolC